MKILRPFCNCGYNVGQIIQKNPEMNLSTQNHIETIGYICHIYINSAHNFFHLLLPEGKSIIKLSETMVAELPNMTQLSVMHIFLEGSIKIMSIKLIKED